MHHLSLQAAFLPLIINNDSSNRSRYNKFHVPCAAEAQLQSPLHL